MSALCDAFEAVGMSGRCLLEQSIEERLQEAEARSQLDMKARRRTTEPSHRATTTGSDVKCCWCCVGRQVREYERLMEGLKAQARIVEDLREGDDEEAMRT